MEALPQILDERTGGLGVQHAEVGEAERAQGVGQQAVRRRHVRGVVLDDALHAVRRRDAQADPAGADLGGDPCAVGVLDGDLERDLAREGRTPRTVLLEHEVVTDEAAAAALDLDPATPLLAIVRLRLAGDAPLAVMRNWLPPAYGDITREAVVEGLKKVDYKGLTNQVKFQSSGEIEKAIVFLYQVKSGKLNLLGTVDSQL